MCVYVCSLYIPSFLKLQSQEGYQKNGNQALPTHMILNMSILPQIINKKHSNIIYLLAISVAISILIFVLFDTYPIIKSHIFQGKPVWV